MTKEKCSQEVFTNSLQSRSAVVCSCGFAITYQLSSRKADEKGKAFFKQMHAIFLERSKVLKKAEQLKQALEIAKIALQIANDGHHERPLYTEALGVIESALSEK